MRGYAIDQGNYIEGVTVVAAPVLCREGSMSHAMIAIGLAGVVERVGVRLLGEALVSATRTIAGNLPQG